MQLTDDIRSMQQYLLEQSANKQWQCIEAGIDQYLGRKVTEADAPFIEVQHLQGTFDITTILYKGNKIGSVTGAWDSDFIGNRVIYTWSWTPEKII